MNKCLLMLLLACWASGFQSAYARCTPGVVTVSAVSPASTVFCVGAEVDFAPVVWIKPCDATYVQPASFWSVAVTNDDIIDDPKIAHDISRIDFSIGGVGYETLPNGKIRLTQPGTGAVSATVTDHPNNGCRGCAGTSVPTPTPASVKVMGGPVTASTAELRWYCGGIVPPDYFYRTVTATEQPANGASYNWTCHGPVRIYSGQGTKEVVLAATGPSATPGDAWATCTYALDGHTCTSDSPHITSREPARAIFNYNIDYRAAAVVATPPGAQGFVSRIHYWVEDQFNQGMGDIYVGERFDDDRYDYWKPPRYPRTDEWPDPDPGGGVWPTPDVYDTMMCWDLPGGVYPDPMDPQWLPGLTDILIYDHTQHTNFGGTPALLGIDGCNLLTVKQTYYIDHGRHL